MLVGNAARRTGLLVIATALGAAALGVMPARAAAGDPFLGLAGQARLTSDVLNHLDQLTPTGTYSPTAPLTIGVSLQRPDAAGENAYIADVYDAKSANFRHFLDVAGFQQRFGVSQARFQATVDWLHQHGLKTSAVKSSTEYVLATGPAAAVESMLGVTEMTYSFNGTGFYANTQAPTVPASLGVLGISGLESWSRMKTMQQWQKNLPASPHGVLPPLPVQVGSTTPSDLWGVYDQPAENTGQGETMAIFGWGATETLGVDVVGNLRSFEDTYGLPHVPVTIDHYGALGEQITDAGGAGEWNLDLPASTGMAPGVNGLHMYFGVSGGDEDILAAYDAWDLDPNGPRQGSSSFAGCEAGPGTGSSAGGPGNPTTGAGQTAIGNPNQDAYEALLKEAVELGRTMFVSAGDLGAQGCPYSFATALNGVTAVPTGLNNYPTVSPWVTAVGGTVLYWNPATHGGPASRFLEYSWTHSGGGTSLFVPAPAWQLSDIPAPGVLYPCTVDWHTPPATYAPGTLCRGIPDVAAQSGDVISNGYVAGGGTSLSSPLWLGMWTRIQAASSNPGRVGFATPAIYANNADATRWARDFFDVGGSSGATAPSCSMYPSPYSCSHAGWDYMTGWGTPDVTNLMKDLDGGNTAPVAFVPAVSVPEVPFAPMLLLAAAIGLVAFVVMRRRHAAAHPAEASAG
ncbi:MAG TPA: S53 family peptidase [Candidatus Angelobacter sp.]|nr:S53 family peptidase [Candidatus Angelobacter sp.]